MNLLRFTPLQMHTELLFNYFNFKKMLLNKTKRRKNCISFFIFHHLFPLEYAFTYSSHFFDAIRNQTSNKKYLLELIKRSSKVHEQNMSHERTNERPIKDIFRKL